MFVYNLNVLFKIINPNTDSQNPFNNFSPIIKWLVWASPILLLWLVLNPFLQNGIIWGHDIATHLIFTRGFAESLFQGQFPVRVIQNGPWPGRVDPIFIFYKPTFYFVFSIFKSIGFLNTVSFNLTIISLWLFSAISMFLLTRKHFGTAAGILSSFFFTLAPYHLAQVFVRSSLTEFTGLAFIPAVLWSLTKLWENKNGPYFFISILIFSAFLLSHPLIILMFFPIVIAYLGYLFYKEPNKNAMILSLIVIVLGFGISAFSLIPSLAEVKYTHISQKINETSDFHDHFVCFSQLFSSNWGYEGSIKGCNDQMPFQIGVLHWSIIFAITLLIITALKKSRKVLKKEIVLLFLFLIFFLFSVFLLLDTSTFLWERFPYLSFMQFPWRFLTLSVFTSSFLAGGLMFFVKDTKNKYLLAFVLILAALYIYPSFISPIYINEKSLDYNGENFLKTREKELSNNYLKIEGWNPVWVKKLPDFNQISPIAAELVSGEGEIKANRLTAAIKEYDLTLKTNSIVRLNTHYFPGWTLYLDGKKASVNFDNDYGYMDVTVSQGNHKLGLAFENTQVRSFSDTISKTSLIFTVLATLSLLFLQRNYRKIKNRN